MRATILFKAIKGCGKYDAVSMMAKGSILAFFKYTNIYLCL